MLSAPLFIGGSIVFLYQLLGWRSVLVNTSNNPLISLQYIRWVGNYDRPFSTPWICFKNVARRAKGENDDGIYFSIKKTLYLFTFDFDVD